METSQSCNVVSVDFHLTLVVIGEYCAFIDILL